MDVYGKKEINITILIILVLVNQYIPIYEITDKEVLDYLLNFSKLKDRDVINLPDKIRNFISERKLIAFNGEVEMTATIHFIEDSYAYSIPKIIFISIAFLIGLYGKYRKSKFSKK